ncbi:UNVERIFIED_CONTAM: DNA polymerase eta [Sesamum latifolium]|uniref:DNA polymerase eta n=1 Tax=Sesamum latifolium TaxID=2727402 RepID=A0AAW2WL12_9LAMI
MYNQDGASTRDCVRAWFLMSDADHRDKLLACGAIIVAELRHEVLKETEFTCSAGIAHNKMLAKLASGMNKPAQQTVVPLSSVEKLLEYLPIKKMKQLGGKLGTSLQFDLGVNTVGDLLQFSEEKLQERYGINTGTWLWNIARGICGEVVEGRLLPKSHGSGKTFPGPQALKTVSSVQKWLNELCEELSERLLCDLEQNKRIARTLTLHASAYKLNDSESLKKFPSKSCPLRYGIAKIQEDALKLFHAGLREYIGVYHVRSKESKHEWAVTGLSVSASKIVGIPSGTHSIMKYFHNLNQTSTTTSNNICTQGAASLSPSGLHLADPQIETYEDDAKTGHEMPTFYPVADETEVCKDLKSDSENGLVSELTQSKMDFIGPGLKSEKQKKKFEKEKGNSSILRFLHSPDACSFPEHARLKTFQESGASSSGNLLQENKQPMAGTTLSTCSLGRNDIRNDAWSYKRDEIDPTVLNELPPEIQAEVRGWLHPEKRAKTVKKGSSIVHYFSSTADV